MSIFSFLEILRTDSKETALREAGGLYIRPDPDSDNAYYREEPGDNVEVGASLVEDGNKYDFIWQRSKSNANLYSHRFTHYLSRYAYADQFRVIDGQKIGKEIVSIRTDEGNSGILCGLRLSKIGYQDKDDDYLPMHVLLVVRQEKHQDNRIRLVTCYPTDNRKYRDWYAKNFQNLSFRNSTKRPDVLDKKDIDDGSQQKLNESIKKMLEGENFKLAQEGLRQTMDDLAREHSDILKRGYHIFQQILSQKNPQ